MENNQTQTPAVATGESQNATQTQNTTQTIDYGKIQGMIDSRNQRNEDAILKDYFKKEGMSEEEMKQAISNFKNTKIENEKSRIAETETLQSDVKRLNAEILQTRIDKEAYIQALELGVDAKTIPYLTKLADFNGVSNDKGIVDAEKVKSALNKVLEDVPSLKSQKDEKLAGVKVGSDNSNTTQPSGNLFNFKFDAVRGQKK